MAIDLRDYSLLLIFLVGLAVMLVFSELGHRLGLRVGVRGADVSTLEGAILGLLALMLGFTFAMALSLFEARRDVILDEANAIGTTALRARLLPDPQRGEALKLLREYVRLRVEEAQGVTAPAVLAGRVARSNAIQEALWQQAMGTVAQNNQMVPTGLFIQALNEMIDSQEKRLTATRNRVPDIVLVALYGVATIASAFAGYASGIKARHWRIPVYTMAVLVSTVILLIQDLDRPSAGFITINLQPMLDTAAGIAGYAD